jgi:hypothetical protein
MLVVLVILVMYAVNHSDPNSPTAYGRPTKSHPGVSSSHKHPIDTLINEGERAFDDLMSRESQTLEQAAAAYRKRRGRHPPPNFNLWWEFAKNRSAVVVEDFFDQVYHDLEPFWGIDPAVIRREASGFEMTIHVRDGKAHTKSDWFWTLIWLDLIQSIETYLPDMDLAMNPMDEPRIIVPWEDMDAHMQKVVQTARLPAAKTVQNSFRKLPRPGKGDLHLPLVGQTFENTSESTSARHEHLKPFQLTLSDPFWKLVKRGCPPTSLARTTPDEDPKAFAEPPIITSEYAAPHTFEGYVSNVSLAKDVCHQPDLQGSQGILIEPLSVSTTKTLFALFGGSKLSVNNEILIPAPVYWDDEERFTGGDVHGGPWGNKVDKVVWRGVATGGRNRIDNWRRFQRHRFVSMTNGTKVSRVAAGLERAENFCFPEEKYKVSAWEEGRLGEWISDWTDTAFMDLMCEPREEGSTCRYTSPHFKLEPTITMPQQFEHKYLPDVDGNSFSGRFLGFIRSTALPIKSTLWREWHDSRIVPWKHFVPMDTRFGDWYGIMEYFLGYNGKNGHDEAARKIATNGKKWAETVLRREDMQIYTLRLLLEYGRVTDERREQMGWVDDLVGGWF